MLQQAAGSGAGPELPGRVQKGRIVVQLEHVGRTEQAHQRWRRIARFAVHPRPEPGTADQGAAQGRRGHHQAEDDAA